ncbi:MAG: replication-associated recombination protein A [Firmicutes bacterium]|nr:replication-associated recombination protein A [Bacillota bacterium]
MRPRRLDEVVGQEAILSPGKLLWRAIVADRLSSLILYGPPGCGKSTLAAVIAETTHATFIGLDAVRSGAVELRKACEEAVERRQLYGQRTLLFVDEIHRLNKAQQDVLLPFVEDSSVVLIGATTENPSFTVNAALLSRSLVFELYPLDAKALMTIAQRALTDTERGLGQLPLEVTEEALSFWVQGCDGDARRLLNALELAATTTPAGADGKIHITAAVAAESIQQRRVRYDRQGDMHYDVISAYIKSIRGSDPDAALFWLATMLEAGEDPRFIARRMVIAAAEDIGLAEPLGLVVAESAAQAVERVGLPEGRIPLAMGTLFLATAPKSNSAYLGIERASAVVRSRTDTGVPTHLRDAHYGGAKKLGHGEGYRYPHDFPGHFVHQTYLPVDLLDARFFQPQAQGAEKKMAQRLGHWWPKRYNAPQTEEP